MRSCFSVPVSFVFSVPVSFVPRIRLKNSTVSFSVSRRIHSPKQAPLGENCYVCALLAAERDSESADTRTR
jgi:hypothetical protein